VLALACLVERFTQAHYRESIAPDPNLSELYKDVFLFHWKEESQHAVLDELEWRREDGLLAPSEREDAVSDLVALIAVVDGVLRQQAQADSATFLSLIKRPLNPAQRDRVQAGILRAYRWQYILSGVQDERFAEIVADLVTESQARRIAEALLPLTEVDRTNPSTVAATHASPLSSPD
jgi:hypothetical protein